MSQTALRATLTSRVRPPKLLDIALLLGSHEHVQVARPVLSLANQHPSRWLLPADNIPQRGPEFRAALQAYGIYSLSDLLQKVIIDPRPPLISS